MVRCLRSPGIALLLLLLLPSCPAANEDAEDPPVDPSPEDISAEEDPPPPDTDDYCPTWAADGECEKNPNFMLASCATTCAKYGHRAKPREADMEIDDVGTCTPEQRESGQCGSMPEASPHDQEPPMHHEVDNDIEPIEDMVDEPPRIPEHEEQTTTLSPTTAPEPHVEQTTTLSPTTAPEPHVEAPYMSTTQQAHTQQHFERQASAPTPRSNSDAKADDWAKDAVVSLYSVGATLGMWAGEVSSQASSSAAREFSKAVTEISALEPPMNFIAWAFLALLTILVLLRSLCATSPGPEAAPPAPRAASAGKAAPASGDLEALAREVNSLRQLQEGTAAELRRLVAESTQGIARLSADLRSFQHERATMDEEMLLSTKEVLMWLSNGSDGAVDKKPHATQITHEVPERKDASEKDDKTTQHTVQPPVQPTAPNPQSNAQPLSQPLQPGGSFPMGADRQADETERLKDNLLQPSAPAFPSVAGPASVSGGHAQPVTPSPAGIFGTSLHPVTLTSPVPPVPESVPVVPETVKPSIPESAAETVNAAEPVQTTPSLSSPGAPPPSPANASATAAAPAAFPPSPANTSAALRPQPQTIHATGNPFGGPQQQSQQAQQQQQEPQDQQVQQQEHQPSQPDKLQQNGPSEEQPQVSQQQKEEPGQQEEQPQQQQATEAAPVSSGRPQPKDIVAPSGPFGARPEPKKNVAAGGAYWARPQPKEIAAASGPFGARPQPKEIAAASGPFGARPQPKEIVAASGPFGARPQPKEIIASSGPFGARPQPKEISAKSSPFG